MRLIPVLAILLLFWTCNNQATNDKPAKDSAGVNSTDKDSSMNGPDVANPPTNDTVFTAFGNEPFWAVYIIRDNKIIFHPADGMDVATPYVNPNTVDSLTTRYASMNAKDTLVLTIIKKVCSDGMSDLRHEYATDLTVNSTHYSGCGRMKKSK